MRKELSKQDKEKWIEEWRASGQSLEAWCKDHNISRSTFYGWIRRFRQLPVLRKKFLELPPGKTMTSHAINIRYQGIDITIKTLER